jgi:dehydrogenase/reductase SDR family protein 1
MATRRYRYTTLLVSALSSDEVPSVHSVVPKLRDCVCLVTGASRGIGKGIALELGKQGAIVYITGTSTSDNSSSLNAATGPYSATKESGGPGTIEQTAQEIMNAGGIGVAVLCNHAVDSEVKHLMDRIERDHGRLDILINNAFRLPQGGVEMLYKKFWEQGPEIWDTLHTVGLRSHFVASVYAMPLLQAAKKNPQRNLPRPFVGMVSSFGGLTYTFNVPYGVGKAGVDRLAKDMAVELTPEDICVVSFWPGVVDTERTQESVKKGDWEKYVGLPLDNAETPGFTGKAIIATATDPSNMRKTGTYQVVAELSEEYNFFDVNGNRPPSIRSLRFLLPSYAFDQATRDMVPGWMIPDWKLPFWVMAQGQPPA